MRSGESLNSGIGHFYVLRDGTSGDTNTADDHAFVDEWDAASQDGDPPLVRRVDPIVLTAG